MLRRIILTIVLGTALTIAAPAGTPLAQEGTWGIGAAVAYYQPGPDLYEDSVSYGVRLAYHLSDNLSVLTELSFVSLDADDGEIDDLGLSGSIETDLTLLDFDAFYTTNPGDWISFAFGGGLGWAWATVDADLSGSSGAIFRAEELLDDTFTANVAAGPEFRLGRSLTLRVMPRLRWYDDRGEDDTDFEAAISLDWNAGS